MQGLGITGMPRAVLLLVAAAVIPGGERSATRRYEIDIPPARCAETERPRPMGNFEIPPEGYRVLQASRGARYLVILQVLPPCTESFPPGRAIPDRRARALLDVDGRRNEGAGEAHVCVRSSGKLRIGCAALMPFSVRGLLLIQRL